MSELRFTLYQTPQPQGSAKAFVRGNRAYITSANSKMMPYRHSLTQVAREAMSKAGLAEPLVGRHVPVEMVIVWTLAKPKSTAKRVLWPAKKPDIDKLARCVLDSLTGVAYVDDGQVVRVTAQKEYGLPESTTVIVRESVLYPDVLQVDFALYLGKPDATFSVRPPSSPART